MDTPAPTPALDPVILRETPVGQFILEGGKCQGQTPDACIAATTCDSKNGGASSGCAPAR